jgi:hypothetical protein
MPHQRHPRPTPLSFPSRPAATASVRVAFGITFGVAFAGGWLSGCAGLLGIEEATCDPDYDPSCAGRSVGMLMPSAGSGGSSPAAGAGGGAGAGGSAGAGGTGGDGAGAGGALGMGLPVEPPLCERYCDTIATACTEDFEQYASPMACRALCALLDPGEPGDFSGNTVECRLARAQLARATGEQPPYCHTAGPGGGGVCGTDCEGFCTIMAQKCTLMGSFEECLPLCSAVPNLTDEDDSLTYATAIQNGDSVQCRLYHVTAATLDSRIHCSHAAGVALCVDD